MDWAPHWVPWTAKEAPPEEDVLRMMEICMHRAADVAGNTAQRPRSVRLKVGDESGLRKHCTATFRKKRTLGRDGVSPIEVYDAAMSPVSGRV